MIHWKDVEFEDGESVRSLAYDGAQDEADRRTRLLREYRRSGEIPGMFLAPIAGQSRDAEDAWKAGPRVHQIHWRAAAKEAEING